MKEAQDDSLRFKPVGDTLTIKFDSQKAAEHFKAWLCEAGEQDYWSWMECREEEEEGPITATRFNYHDPGKDMVVATCGRLNTSK